VVKAATAGVDVSIDWDTARLAFQQASGVPVRVGERNFSRVPVRSPESVPAPAAETAQAPAP
jgi:hypothetical protein